MIYKTETEFIEPYLKDASNFKGSGDKIIIPENALELKDAVLECFKTDIPMTISGAGTGLTGGRAPLSGAVISIERLNKIISIDFDNRIAVVEPAVTLIELENALQPEGFFYPPNPTEKNSSLGGNVSTNASGARTFKYGATRTWTHALKIQLSNGDELYLERGKNYANFGKLELVSEKGRIYKLFVTGLNMPDIKHTAGYYLKPDMDAIHLFIGSEGTLGIVKEISLRFLPLPEQVIGGVIFFDDENLLLDFVAQIREISLQNNTLNYKTNNLLSSRVIEFFDRPALELLREEFPQIPSQANCAIWFEQECIIENEERILNRWYEFIGKYTSLADDTWIALNQKEHTRLRDFRHTLPLKVNEIISANNQRKIGTDIAVPNEFMKEYYYFLKRELAILGIYNVSWGHIGNSHFHANVLPSNNYEYSKAIEFYDKCISESLRLGGTIAGEHGIGKIKKKYLLQMFGREGIEQMKNIKKILDPKGLFGHGNLFD